MCIVGKYCFEKFIYEIGDCSFGFYCLINIIDGVLSLRIGLYGFIQEFCLKGSFFNELGGRFVEDCIECIIGYYCLIGFQIFIICKIGYYCFLGLGDFQFCFLGIFNNYSGVYYLENCIDCIFGW